MADRARVFVLSDVPGTPTGFGGQAPVLIDAVRAAGAEPVALGMCIGPSNDVLGEPRTLADGTRCYAIPYQPSATILKAAFDREQPAAVLALSELWMIETLSALDAAARRKALLWIALDCPFLPEARARWLATFGGAVAVASYGERVLEPVQALGGRVHLIPHAVRRELEVPSSHDDIAARRRAHGVEDCFVALSVGRNQFRKGQPYLLDAWAKFVAGLPAGDRGSVRLFLHGEQQPAPFAPVQDPVLARALAQQTGWDLPALIEKHFADWRQQRVLVLGL